MMASASISTRSAESNEAADFDHRCSGADSSEELAVNGTDLFPAIDVGDEHPGAYHVVKASSNFFERGLDPGERLVCLCADVIASHRASTDLYCGGAGHAYPRSDANGAGEADRLFVVTSRRNQLTLRHRPIVPLALGELGEPIEGSSKLVSSGSAGASEALLVGQP